MLINIDQISDLTGSTRRTVLKRLQDLPRQKGSGRSILYESTDALPIMFGLGKPSDKKSLEKERTRLTSAQAEKTELEIEVIKGNLVPKEQIIGTMGPMISAFRAKMLSLPTKAAPVVVNEVDAAQVEIILREYVYEALDELSEYEPTSTTESDAPDSVGTQVTRRAPAPPDSKSVGRQREEVKQGSKRRTRTVEH